MFQIPEIYHTLRLYQSVSSFQCVVEIPEYQQEGLWNSESAVLFRILGWGFRATSEWFPDPATDLEDSPSKLSGLSSFFRFDFGLLRQSVVEILERGARPGRKTRP